MPTLYRVPPISELPRADVELPAECPSCGEGLAAAGVYVAFAWDSAQREQEPEIVQPEDLDGLTAFPKVPEAVCCGNCDEIVADAGGTRGPRCAGCGTPLSVTRLLDVSPEGGAWWVSCAVSCVDGEVSGATREEAIRTWQEELRARTGCSCEESLAAERAGGEPTGCPVHAEDGSVR